MPYMPPGMPPMPPDGGKKPEQLGNPKPGEEVSAPATLVVLLPADARLLVDGVVTVSQSERRVFVSPALPPDQQFHYVLKAEVMRDGKPVSVEERVAVSAGKVSEVRLNLPAAGIAQR
jgi:uncharacterized protein (TIGR03000 family)